MNRRQAAKRAARISQFVHRLPPEPEVPVPSLGAQIKSGMVAAFPTVLSVISRKGAANGQPIDQTYAAADGHWDPAWDQHAAVLEDRQWQATAPHTAQHVAQHTAQHNAPWHDGSQPAGRGAAPAEDVYHPEPMPAAPFEPYHSEEPSFGGDDAAATEQALPVQNAASAFRRQLRATMMGAFPTVVSAVAPQALEQHRNSTALALEPLPVPTARLELASRVKTARKLMEVETEPSPESRRGAPRRATSTPAQIIFDEISVPIRCRVADQSASGARIVLEPIGKDIPFTVRDLPYDIRLIFPAERMAAECRIVWRSGMELGLKYQSAWRPYVPSYAGRTSDNRKTQPARDRR